MRLSPVEKIESFGTDPTYPEAVTAIRAEHGRATSHWVADRLTLSLRQAQRYLSPHPPHARRPDVLALVLPHRLIEDRLRRTNATTKGTVEVDYSPSGPLRRIPHLIVTGGLRGLLDEAAAHIAQDQRYLAATAFEQYVLLGYGGGTIPEEMSIKAYLEGIELELDPLDTAEPQPVQPAEPTDEGSAGPEVPLF